MTIEKLIKYIKDSCMVADPDITNDTEFIALTDEQIMDIISIASIKAKVNLSDLENADTYRLSLIAKKELFYRLATLSAPLYNLEGDGNSLSRSDRFDHYYKLIGIVEEEYTHYMDELERNVDVSNSDNYGNKYSNGEVLLDSRYFSNRNYKHSKAPKITLKVDNIYSDYIEVSWDLKAINRFSRYELLFNETKNIIDEYEDKISDGTKVLFSTIDIHKTKFRIKDLKPSTTYHLAIKVTEQNGLYGYDELQFVTTEVM